MNKVIIISVALLLVSSVLGQEAKVLLNQYGFGKTPDEVKFTIHCSGDIPISGITIYVDGQEYKKFPFTLDPKKGISTTIILEPGEHLVEVRTAEGAYDSEIVVVSSVENRQPPENEIISFTKTNTFKGIVVFVIPSVVIVWLLAKRQKLDLSQ